jgi:hypothetical protein
VHMVYFEKYNITNRDLLESAPNPATESYNSYLIKTADCEPFAVGLTAILAVQLDLLPGRTRHEGIKTSRGQSLPGMD